MMSMAILNAVGKYRRKENKVSRIDPGLLVPKSDTLTSRLRGLEITVHIGQIIRVSARFDFANKVKKRDSCIEYIICDVA